MWLAIDTATDRASVALGTADGPVFEESLAGARRHASQLLPMVEALLRQAGVTLEAAMTAAAFVWPVGGAATTASATTGSATVSPSASDTPVDTSTLSPAETSQRIADNRNKIEKGARGNGALRGAQRVTQARSVVVAKTEKAAVGSPKARVNMLRWDARAWLHIATLKAVERE